MEMNHFKPLIFISLTCFLVFLPAFTSKKILAPLDLLAFEAPWVTKVNPQNSKHPDIQSEFYPWKKFIKNSQKVGDSSLWAPGVALGYPVFSKGNTSYLSLNHLMLKIFDLPQANNFLFVFYVFLTMTGYQPLKINVTSNI